MAGVSQGVAAAMAQHMDVDRKGEGSALAEIGRRT
jgi:hypothetical protein